MLPGHPGTWILGMEKYFCNSFLFLSPIWLLMCLVTKDAQAWLEKHAELYGEQSPMTGCTYLPWGRRSEYYALYLFERSLDGDLAHLDGQAADQKTFMAAWRCEAFHVQIASRTSMFVACAACKFLQGLIAGTGREQDALLQALRYRLGRHYSFQASQRLADEKLTEGARRSNNTEWQHGNHDQSCYCMSIMCKHAQHGKHEQHGSGTAWQSWFSFHVVRSGWLRHVQVDKMDQSKTNLPCVHSMFLGRARQSTSVLLWFAKSKAVNSAYENWARHGHRADGIHLVWHWWPWRLDFHNYLGR